MDKGASWAIIHGVAKELDMTEQLNDKQLTYDIILISGIQHTDSLFVYIVKWSP